MLQATLGEKEHTSTQRHKPNILILEMGPNFHLCPVYRISPQNKKRDSLEQAPHLDLGKAYDGEGIGAAIAQTGFPGLQPSVPSPGVVEKEKSTCRKNPEAIKQGRGESPQERRRVS